MTLVQLCFILCEHKCWVINGKHVVNVLVQMKCVCVCLCVCERDVSLPYKTELSSNEKKEVSSLLHYINLDKRKITPVTKHHWDPRVNTMGVFGGWRL